MNGIILCILEQCIRSIKKLFIAIILYSNGPCCWVHFNVYITFQSLKKRNNLYKDCMRNHHHHHLGCHVDHHIDHQIYGDNVHHYNEHHLDIYLYFHHFFLGTKKDNTAEPYRVPDSNKHYHIQDNFGHQHFLSETIVLVSCWEASVGNFAMA